MTEREGGMREGEGKERKTRFKGEREERNGEPEKARERYT